jgi:hypothetical protein
MPLLARTGQCLIPAFFALGIKTQLTLTTAAPTVRPAEDTGYNRVAPGRTARSSQMEFKYCLSFLPLKYFKILN